MFIICNNKPLSLQRMAISLFHIHTGLQESYFFITQGSFGAVWDTVIGVYFEVSLKATAKTSLGLFLWTPNLSPELPTLPHLNLLSTTNSLSVIFKICHSSAQTIQ